MTTAKTKVKRRTLMEGRTDAVTFVTAKQGAPVRKFERRTRLGSC